MPIKKQALNKFVNPNQKFIKRNMVFNYNRRYAAS